MSNPKPRSRWNRIARLVAAPLALLPFAGGCAVAPEDAGEGSTESDIIVVDPDVSVDEIMARAHVWVDQKVPYCGGARGGSDVICGGTCVRPSAPWNAFRSDCSGFVSWAWQLADVPSTSTFIRDRAGAKGWRTVSANDLQPGDALVCNGHIKLLSRVVSAGQAEILEEFDCGQVARSKVQAFTRSGNTFRFAGDGRVYHAIRRNGLVASDAPARPSPAPVSSATVEVSWSRKLANTEYSLDVVLDDDSSIAPCVGNRTIGTDLSYRFDGHCVTPNLGVDLGRVKELRICSAENEDWAHAACTSVAYDGKAAAVKIDD